MTQQFKEFILYVAQYIQEASEKRVCLVEAPDCHFLSFDGKQIGICVEYINEPNELTYEAVALLFIANVLFDLREYCPEVYESTCQNLFRAA